MTAKAPDKVKCPESISTKKLQDLLDARKQDNNKLYHVVLWNDPVNSIDHVVGTLLKVIEEIQDLNTAVALTMTAHKRGSVYVARCDKARAEEYRNKLQAARLTATLEQA